MAEDSVFDSGLSGVLGNSSGSQKSAEWEENLLDSLTEEELESLVSEQPGDTVRMASSVDSMDPDALEEEMRRDVRRAAVSGQDVSDDLAALAAEMESAEQAGWGSGDKDIARFVTGKLYEGHSPKQIRGLLNLMYPTGRVDAFWADCGKKVLSKYGRLGFLYIDASDFHDDVEMDEMLGGQKKIGQMALESIKPAARCGDCTLNRGGFCMRYNLALDSDPVVKNARQARRVLGKFARLSDAAEQRVAKAQDAVDAVEASKSPDPREYDRIVSGFLTEVGQPQAGRKGDTGKARLPGATEAATRPQPRSDADVEAFVRARLAESPGMTFAELRGSAMSSLGRRRAKAWFRSNRTAVVRLVEGAARDAAAAGREKESRDVMDKVQETLETRHGPHRAKRIMEARGDDPERYAGVLGRSSDTETRRIGTGQQSPRTMPDSCKARPIGRLDDEMREAARAAAARGVPAEGIRANLVSKFGEKRLAAFERDCPDDIREMAARAGLGFGAEDDEGARAFEESLERNGGNVRATVSEIRRSLGRRRAAMLISQHPRIEAATAAASRTHGAAAADASDRRIASSEGAARPLVPEGSIDFDAIAREAAEAAEPEPEMLASSLPPAKLDPTLVAQPEMDDVEPGYTVPGDAPDPLI